MTFENNFDPVNAPQNVTEIQIVCHSDYISAQLLMETTSIGLACKDVIIIQLVENMYQWLCSYLSFV